MKHLDSRDMQVFLELDERCFGASRRILLEAICDSPSSMCGGVLKEGRPAAYLMAAKSLFSAEVGPWVCERGQEEEGFRLFRSLGDELRGLEAHVGVPSARSEVVDFLSGLGFVEDFSVVRMFRGPAPPDRGCVLAMESLERG